MPNVTVYVMTAWRNLPTKSSPIDQTHLNNIEQGIKNLNDWVNTLNVETGKIMGSAAFTTALKTKLDGIEAQANKYVLPVATNTTLGGVKIDNRTIIINDGVISGRGEISTLLDVVLTNLDDGETLVWDEQSGKWVNTLLRTKISLLEDVNLTDLANNEVLVWDAQNEEWVNTTPKTRLALLEDVEITSPTDKQVLKYNEESQKWENGESGEVLNYDDTIAVLGLPPNPVYRYRELIPKMTSNTTPSGVVSAGSNHSNFPCWKAVDQGGTENDRWLTVAGVTTSYWQYKFDTGKRIDRFKICFGALPQNSHNFFDAGIKIQASNDGTTFTDLFDFTLLAAENNIPQIYEVDNPDEYMYYRIQFAGKNASAIASGNQYNAIISVQMYEKYLA